MKKGEYTLQKLLHKNRNMPLNDKDGIFIWTQILMSYKFFDKNNLVYGKLNPGNLVKFGHYYKLTYSSDLFVELENLGENTQEDFIYYSPEKLIGEEEN